MILNNLGACEDVYIFWKLQCHGPEPRMLHHDRSICTNVKKNKYPSVFYIIVRHNNKVTVKPILFKELWIFGIVCSFNLIVI